MKVAVLMSGGVDSTVAALLLLEQGYEVLGLTMIHMDHSVGEKAARVAEDLGIPHFIVDLRSEFEAAVVDPFCREYEQGRTPNPCVQCNERIKFGLLLEEALKHDADKVATGHYARIEFDQKKDCYRLRKGRDLHKDQTYFLYRLSQDQLARVLFPLGNYTKEEVREIARAHGLEVAESKESQEICFIADDYREFIRPRVGYQGGDFVDEEGRILGRHQGIPFYTVGQRKGLGVSAGRPVYVHRIDPETNTIVLGDNEALFTKVIRSDHNHFSCGEKPADEVKVQAKIRYAAREAEAVLSHVEGDIWELVFSQAQRAATPGQSVVYYQDEYVLGGGIIL